MEGSIHRDAHPLLAFPHAEGAAQFNLITQILFGNQLLQLLHHRAGTLDMTGRTNANRYFHVPDFLFSFTFRPALVSLLMESFCCDSFRQAAI